MIAPRRFLPSISSLLALEAVDRLGTATAAAEDLALTHSAVSRQLKVLEEQLGVGLLVRDGKALALTPAGARYAHSVRGFLQDLARASLELRASGSRDVINLAVLPAFGMYWLTPRLKPFLDAHPGILVNQRTRLSRFNFGLERFDAAIHFGIQDWPGVNYLELARERLVPVCAARIAPAPPLQPEALLGLPLLHLESRPGAWETWFRSHGCDAGQLRGPLFDQFGGLAAAAAAGLGAALLPDFLAAAEIAQGRVIPIGAAGVDSAGAYHLVWPQANQPTEALRSLIDFLRRSRLSSI